MDYNFNPNEISFNDLPKAVAHLISEVQTLKTMVQTGVNCTEDADKWAQLAVKKTDAAPAVTKAAETASGPVLEVICTMNG